MPLFSLPNGKAVDIPLEWYLLSDQDFDMKIQQLMAQNSGWEVEDAFHKSFLTDTGGHVLDVLEEEEELPKAVDEYLENPEDLNEFIPDDI